MILLDDREGSSDLSSLLRELGISVETSRLESGDAMMIGHGPSGMVSVGVEVKQVHDMLSSIATGRFSGHQLPSMLETYDYQWLVVEGLSREETSTGILQVPAGRGLWKDAVIGSRTFMYRELECFLMSLELRTSVKWRSTVSRRSTASFLAHLHHWWTSKEWDDHRSHLSLYQGGDAACLSKASLVRRVACQLPGIGWKKSGLVAAKFKSVKILANATEDEWKSIEGIGKKLSRKIVSDISE